MKEKIKSILESSINTKKSIIENEELLNNIQKAINLCIETIHNNNFIFFCGNGGSAADAQHISAELTGRFKQERKPLKGIVLGSNFSSMTAIANDYGYNDVFSRELTGLASENDLLICYTTSGNSENIIHVLKTAKELGIRSILFTGMSGGLSKDFSHISICIPSEDTARIQESHIALSHTMFEIFEDMLLNA